MWHVPILRYIPKSQFSFKKCTVSLLFPEKSKVLTVIKYNQCTCSHLQATKQYTAKAEKSLEHTALKAVHWHHFTQKGFNGDSSRDDEIWQRN